MSLDDLAQAALMGTARQAPPRSSLPLESPPAAGPEQQLLREAAILAVHREAGRKPERVADLGQPAPPETRPAASTQASAHLTVILGTYPELLPEWLGALAATGRVIPPAHVRALLDRATSDAATALALEPVLSHRARWLATQHGPWGFATHADPSERWETGSRGERLHVLAITRARDPQLGRELVESTFAQDSANDREAFLGGLRAHLSHDDEPFLAQALTNRAQGVRATAAQLLSALPHSAFSRSMRAHATELVDIGRRTITVHFPEQAPPELTGRSPTPGLGRTASIAHEIISLAPLDAFDPELAGRRVADGNGDLLRDAWALAAARQGNAAWAAALFARAPNADTTRALFALLPQRAAEDHVKQSLKGRSHAYHADWLADALPHPWSEDLTRAVAAWIAKADYPGAWAEALGVHGATTLADRLPQLDPASNAAAALRVAGAQLALRRAMLATLKETPAA